MTLDRSSFGSVLRNSTSASEEAPPCRALGAMTHYPRVYLLALIDAECQWTRPTLSSHHSRRPPRKQYLHKRSEIGRSGVIRLSSTECEWTVDVAARGCSGLRRRGCGLWTLILGGCRLSCPRDWSSTSRSTFGRLSLPMMTWTLAIDSVPGRGMKHCGNHRPEGEEGANTLVTTTLQFVLVSYESPRNCIVHDAFFPSFFV